ncbi:MAG: hypothetical protein ABI422_04285 [Sphingomicrobium sp.]
MALVSAAVASAQTVGVAPAQDFSTVPAMAGSWTYQALPGASEARFIDTTNIARLVLRCTRAVRQVSISRTSSVAAPSIFVWTSSASRNLPARFEPNAVRVTAELSAFDPLLDALAFSRGRIAVTMPGGLALVVPAWPEAARTIEDCRI